MYTYIEEVFSTVSRNLGLRDWEHYIDEWIEWAYEAERYIGSVDTFRQIETTYTSTGAKASGSITFTNQPSSGDWVEFNGTRLYFRNDTDLGQARSSNEIRIGSSRGATLSRATDDGGLFQSLSGYLNAPTATGILTNSAALNYPETIGVADYSIDTDSSGNTNKIIVTAKEIGLEGNKYSLGSNDSNAAISGLNLTGGKGLYRNQQIILPKNMVKLLGVRVGVDDSSHQHKELRKTSATHRDRVGRDSDNTEQKAFRYYVDGNRLNIQHDDLDEITLVYLEFPTDMRGWPMIKESHGTAVAQYIMWQHKLIDFYNGKIAQYIVKDLEKRWYFLCGKARGDDSMPTSEALKQIGLMWNTLVPLRNRRGLVDF
tara:strand:- start:5787 stop:6902 length:1116 start_codon:yes stop_codon:yes gene_type:complete